MVLFFLPLSCFPFFENLSYSSISFPSFLIFLLFIFSFHPFIFLPPPCSPLAHLPPSLRTFPLFPSSPLPISSQLSSLPSWVTLPSLFLSPSLPHSISFINILYLFSSFYCIALNIPPSLPPPLPSLQLPPGLFLHFPIIHFH